MESPRDIGSKPAPAPRNTCYSAKSTPTCVFHAEDVDEHARISQDHQTRPDETTSAYLLKWTDAEVTKTHIDSVAHLRSCFQDDGNSTCHLFVFHGLPVDYGVALKKMDIDASFIEAHIGRRGYRPLRRMKAGWAHYDYPELVYQSPILGNRRHNLMGDPPAYLISSSGDSVMLCRASIWFSEKAHILLLDQAPWADPKSGVSVRRYEAYTTEKMPDENGVSTVMIQIDANGNATTLGDEIPDLETMLCDNLQDNCTSREGILKLLEDLAINKWGEFFETLDADLSIDSADTAALFSQALCCLERNLDVSRQRYKIARRSANTGADMYSLDTNLQPTTTEWEALLARLNRRAQLSSYIRPVVANVKMPPQRPSAKIDSAGGLGISSAEDHANNCHCKSRNNYNNGMNCSGQPDENQRSLNRVAYLGGVLLPFSVVSGILAIEDPFGPGNSQFWIFWAVTIPLVLITMGVIYADSIRKAEVWIEVTAASSKSDTDSSRHRASIAPDVEQALPVSGRFAEFAIVNDTASVENADAGEPDRIVEKRWKSADRANAGRPASGEDHWARKQRWRKEELGWMGAFATIFQLYKLKTGVPPERLRRD